MCKYCDSSTDRNFVIRDNGKYAVLRVRSWNNSISIAIVEECPDCKELLAARACFGIRYCPWCGEQLKQEDINDS